MNEKGTYDMYFSEEHIWDVNTVNERNAYWSRQEITIYFTNSLYWDNFYYYVYDKDDNREQNWPGKKLTFDKTNDMGQDIYKLTIPKNVYSKLIVNNKSSYQTVSIDISNITNKTAYYIKNEKNSSGYYLVSTWNY